MMDEKKTTAKQRYDARTAVFVTIKLNRNTDGDILEHLATKDNRQGYIKQLIRKDIAKGSDE